MWTIEDLHELNPADRNQNVSFLSQLLLMGATATALLSEVSDTLEARNGPYVAAFAQLPFDLGWEATQVIAPGHEPNSTVELLLRPCTIGIDPLGKPTYTTGRTTSTGLPSTVVTQVIGIIRLGTARARIHEVYLNRLNRLWLLDQPLGNHKIENWMCLEEAKRQEPIRPQTDLTGVSFQREVAGRAREHLLSATNAVLYAYSIANLEELPPLTYLYGYHIMIAPGRIACANAPRPVLAGLLPPPRTQISQSVHVSNIFDILRSKIRLEDPVVRQLQAMNRLLFNGEASLALIGCVTAIEWFLNSRFPNIGYTNRNGHWRSASLSFFLKSEYASLLSRENHDFLKLVVDRRNKITHGPPPERGGISGVSGEHSIFVRNALFVALEVYRIVNARTQSTTAPDITKF